MRLGKLAIFATCLVVGLGVARDARASFVDTECCTVNEFYDGPEGRCTYHNCGSNGGGEYLECTGCNSGYELKTKRATICGSLRVYNTCERDESGSLPQKCTCSITGTTTGDNGREYVWLECDDGTKYQDYTKCLSTETLAESTIEACYENRTTHKCVNKGGSSDLLCSCTRSSRPISKTTGETYYTYSCTNGDSYFDYTSCATGTPSSVTVRACNDTVTLTIGECRVASDEFCPAGQYLNPLKGCVDCPPPGTSDAGATAITQCYVKNVEMEDEMGKYTYDDRCYYSMIIEGGGIKDPGLLEGSEEPEETEESEGSEEPEEPGLPKLPGIDIAG